MATSWFNNKMVLCGPYVGSIKEEILSFRPFVCWLRKNFNFPNFLVSTHYNRRFLYDENILPIFKQYTKDEGSQNEHKHDKINYIDFTYIINDIKDQISEISNFNKGDIITYHLGYSSIPNISIFQKSFQPIRSITPNKNNSIIFIPDNIRPESEHREIFNFFKNKYDIEVVGDTKTGMGEYNHLFYDLHYYDNVYYNMVEKIMGCKAVIVPCSHWTVICNIHKIPVFSWGSNVTQYKSIYKFQNKNSCIVPIEKNRTNILLKSIENFLEDVYEKTVR